MPRNKKKAASKAAPAPVAAKKAIQKKAAAPKKAAVANPLLAPGVNRYSKNALRRMKGVHKSKTGKFPTTAAKKKAAAQELTTRMYSTEDVSTPLNSRKNKQHACKVRASIKPGTVLILLAGAHAAKRVVCLKALGSGLLLVSGPYKCNGVPLRRVNQSYVIATSTTVNVNGINVSKFTDRFFEAEKKNKVKAGGAEEFFEGDDEEPKNTVSEERKADQAVVDGALLAQIEKVPDLGAYLSRKFTLTKVCHSHGSGFPSRF